MSNDRTEVPLYVDLDGTFIKTDLLVESFFSALRSDPLIVFKAILWLFKGRSYLKSRLAQRAKIELDLLPLNCELHQYLKEQKVAGRTLILATASDSRYAESLVCTYPDLFSSYLASDENLNLKGEAKLEAIKREAQVFDYAGNALEDFVIFKEAEESILVNPTTKAAKAAQSQPMTKTLDRDSGNLMIWLKQLRVHQWIKNTLIFVPLLVSGSYQDIFLVGLSLLGFVSFSLLASATYILNDLFDLNADRLHERKRNRPLASGSIAPIDAVKVGAGMALLSAISAIGIGFSFFAVLIAYLLITLLYSVHLKKKAALDVITLASLYTVRILAGAAILNVYVSFWLLTFSMFLFLSLALIKRCTELLARDADDNENVIGRGYYTGDYQILCSIGTSSALMAILTFCFYINNNALTNQYQEPALLWLILPSLCYWLMRMWIKTHRNEMHDDPIVFSIKDPVSVITVALIALVSVVAQG